MNTTLQTQVVKVIDMPLPFVAAIYHEGEVLTIGTFKSKTSAKKWGVAVIKALEQHVVFTDALLDRVTAEIKDDFDLTKH